MPYPHVWIEAMLAFFFNEEDLDMDFQQTTEC